jgi:hypothetical protein
MCSEGVDFLFGCWPSCWVCRKVNAQKKLILFFGCWPPCWVCRKVNAQKKLICFFFFFFGLLALLGVWEGQYPEELIFFVVVGLFGCVGRFRRS